MMSAFNLCCFFFFQAEDGIRDRNVTGVQTCALPICLYGVAPRVSEWFEMHLWEPGAPWFSPEYVQWLTALPGRGVVLWTRSEERRVGKECRSRWSPEPSKKKTGSRVDVTRRVHRCHV